MTRLPLTKPIYMRELGKRMGLPSREARTVLRKLEHARGVRLLFSSRTERQGRLWTTEALIWKHCPELVDRSRRALGEVRSFTSRVSEKMRDLEQEMEKLEAKQEQELSELRASINRLKAGGAT
jgi:hypothetical protein